MIKLIRLITVAAMGAGLVSGAASAQTVSFASLPQGSLIYFQATVISKMLLSKTDLKVRVTPMRGTEAEIAAVERGQAEFLIVDVTQAAAALGGREAFKGRAAKNLRAASMLVSFPVGFVVKKDSPIKRISGLKGKRLPSGWKAFNQAKVLMQAMLATGGLKLSDLKPVPTPGMIRAANDFKSGKSDGTVLTPTTPKTKELDAALGGVRFLDIGGSPASLAAVKSIRKDFYITKLTPKPFLTGIVAPTNMLTFDVALATGTHVSDETIYKVIKALHENKATLAKGHPTFRAFRPGNMGKRFSALNYHRAAEKFLKEKGIWPKP